MIPFQQCPRDELSKPSSAKRFDQRCGDSTYTAAETACDVLGDIFNSSVTIEASAQRISDVS
jgi:hypothetical protein